MLSAAELLIFSNCFESSVAATDTDTAEFIMFLSSDFQQQQDLKLKREIYDELVQLRVW